MKIQKFKIAAPVKLLFGGALIFALFCFACSEQSANVKSAGEGRSINGSLKAAYLGNFVAGQTVKEQGEKMWGGQYPRRLPLLEIKTDTVLKAEDFGVKPDTGECMTGKFNSMLRAAAEKSPCKVVLKKGVYNFKKSFGNSNFALSLNGLKDVQLIGAGSTLLVNKPEMGVFMAHAARRVVVEGFAIDYNPLPFSTGVVVANNTSENTADIEIFDGQLPFDSPWLKNSEWGIFLDKTLNGRLQTGKNNVYFHESITRISDRVFRIKLHASRGGGSKASAFLEGDIYSIVIRPSAAVGSLYRTKDFTFKDIQIKASAGSGFSGVYNEAPNFINCRLSMPAGRGRVSNSDTFHFQNSIVGPWIENCVSEGVADDAANFYISPKYVVSVAGQKTLRVSGNPKAANFADTKFNPEDFSAGDTVAFFNGKKCEVFFESKVVRVDAIAGTVSFADKLPENLISCGADKFANTTLYNLNFSSGFVVKNSVFRNSRRYGLYIKASNGLIEGNVFEGLSAEAIMSRNEPGWPEGLYARNLIMANNVFKGCGFENFHLVSKYASTISVSASAKAFDKNCHVYKNIIIEGNVFENWRRSCVFARNVEGLKVQNNTVLKPADTESGFSSPAPQSFDIDNCKNTEIQK